MVIQPVGQTAVGRIKHVKFIQPVEPTVASLTRTINCRADSWTNYENEVSKQPIESRYKGPSIKYVTLFLMIFDLPPLSQTVTNLEPPLKVCHTSEQKVNKQISRMETALNNYNRHYYIFNNNKRPYWEFLINHEIPLQVSFLTTPKVIVAA